MSTRETLIVAAAVALAVGAYVYVQRSNQKQAATVALPAPTLAPPSPAVVAAHNAAGDLTHLIDGAVSIFDSGANLFHHFFN